MKIDFFVCITNNILGWLVFYKEKSTIEVNYLQVFIYPAMIFLSKLFWIAGSYQWAFLYKNKYKSQTRIINGLFKFNFLRFFNLSKPQLKKMGGLKLATI